MVKLLPYSEKLQLSQELERELLNSRLTAFLSSFKTDELSLETITEEVEAARGKIHSQKQPIKVIY